MRRTNTLRPDVNWKKTPSQFKNSVVQLLSCVWLFAIPWTAIHQASLSFTISWSLLELMSIELMMPSNLLILCCPLLLRSIFPSIKVFSNELALHIKGPKYWSFSISPSDEYSGLISFRTDWFDLAGEEEYLVGITPKPLCFGVNCTGTVWGRQWAYSSC